MSIIKSLNKYFGIVDDEVICNEGDEQSVGTTIEFNRQAQQEMELKLISDKLYKVQDDVRELAYKVYELIKVVKKLQDELNGGK